MARQTRSRARFVPGWRYTLFCFVPIGFLVWVWSVDAFGDRGVKNVVSAFGVTLSGLAWFGWFVLRSRWPARVRYGALVAGILLVVGFFCVARFEGVTGSMVPSFSWRWLPEAIPDLAVPESAEESLVDLHVTSPTDFPGFLGARRDLTVRGVRLDRDWVAHPPELIWKQPIGQGWSAFAIVNGVAVTQEQRGAKELVSAYELETGELLWMHAEGARKDHPAGGVGPRSTPLIDEGRVFALGATGILVCLDGSDGSLIWRKELTTEFGITPELEAELCDYGRSNSPLVVGNDVIVPVGGGVPERMAGLVAYDKAGGTPRWKGPPRRLSQASPGFARLAETDQVLIVNEDSVSGHDPDYGTLLWEHAWPGRTSSDANCSQARAIPPDRVLVSKGFGRGAALLRLSPVVEDPNGALGVDVLWATRRSLRTKFTNVVVSAGYVYALSDGILECVELETGRRVWKAGRYGHGQLLLVEDLLLLITEEGELLLIEASPDRRNHVLGRIAALEGKTWNNLALSGDLLAVRNASEAAVYRLKTR